MRPATADLSAHQAAALALWVAALAVVVMIMGVTLVLTVLISLTAR